MRNIEYVGSGYTQNFRISGSRVYPGSVHALDPGKSGSRCRYLEPGPGYTRDPGVGRVAVGPGPTKEHGLAPALPEAPALSSAGAGAEAEGGGDATGVRRRLAAKPE